MTIVIFILALYVLQANRWAVPDFVIVCAWVAMMVRFLGWLIRVYANDTKKS